MIQPPHATPSERLRQGRDHYAETLPVITRLQGAGYQAVLVGGGVRDLVLERPVTDWDIATDAPPEAVLGLFPNAVPTGIQHGTVTVVHEGDPFEVTTFRKDGPYSDGRHPDWVEFKGTLEDDLARRDFTINALAYDPLAERLYDHHRGIADLHEKVIRTVGNPGQRFEEDGLRPLRGIRLACALDFTIEADTFRAMSESGDRLRRVAEERIRDELNKMMQSRKPSRGLDYLRRSSLLSVVLPELLEGYGMYQNRYHAHDVFWHTLYSVDAAPADNLSVRWAALLHDIAKPRTREMVHGEGTFYNHQVTGADMAKDILGRLRHPKKVQERVTRLVQEHMFHYTPEWTDSAVRRFIQRVGREMLDDLFALRIADNIGNGLKEPEPQGLLELRRRVLEILKREDALTLDALAVGGEDVMRELTLTPGPQVGDYLRRLLEEVVEDPALNEREILLGRLRELARESKS